MQSDRATSVPIPNGESGGAPGAGVVVPPVFNGDGGAFLRASMAEATFSKAVASASQEGESGMIQLAGDSVSPSIAQATSTPSSSRKSPRSRTATPSGTKGGFGGLNVSTILEESGLVRECKEAQMQQ